MIMISPSILSADFLKLGEELKKLEQAGADLIHVDVMDGHFVPNLTMGPVVIKAIKKQTSIPLDVHLMITNPDESIKKYAESGADYLTFHIESSTHPQRTIQQIKSYGKKAGLALNPATHESALQYVASELDLILVMSVNPGFSGQKFLPSTIKKVSALKLLIAQESNDKCIISVDGGVNEVTAKPLCQAGANCLVSGSHIFNSMSYSQTIETLKLIGKETQVS